MKKKIEDWTEEEREEERKDYLENKKEAEDREIQNRIAREIDEGRKRMRRILK